MLIICIIRYNDWHKNLNNVTIYIQPTYDIYYALA